MTWWPCTPSRRYASRCTWTRSRSDWYRASSLSPPRCRTQSAAHSAVSHGIRITDTNISVGRRPAAFSWCSGTIHWTSLCCSSSASGQPSAFRVVVMAAFRTDIRPYSRWLSRRSWSTRLCVRVCERPWTAASSWSWSTWTVSAISDWKSKICS